MFSMVIAPMMMFGCAYYPWSALKAFPGLQYAVLINPLVYASEGLRGALAPQIPHIPLLAVHFLARMEKESGVERTFSDESLSVIEEYDWQGNVRELEHAIERACTLSSGPVLHMGDLPIPLKDFRMHRKSAEREAVAARGAPEAARTYRRPRSAAASALEWTRAR